jgi:hypothetical protein
MVTDVMSATAHGTGTADDGIVAGTDFARRMPTEMMI